MWRQSFNFSTAATIPSKHQPHTPSAHPFTPAYKKAMIFGALQRCLSTQFSITFKMSTVLITLFLIGVTTVVMIRYRVTTKYSRLTDELDKDEEEEQAMVAEMWKEPSESVMEPLEPDSRNASLHFDEFLKAIKVFGFLDHEVFTELTKSTQTLRIQQGEQVKLAELGGFAVVISGSMKVYCQSESPEGNNDMDMLNEITVGSPISSLSSILSLFTDGIDTEQRTSEFDKVNATTVAVASKNSTIVIIPADAFLQLTNNFPYAAANIVQIILFRWSQVTFRTCQRYLNLTQQFYGTEQSLNETAKARLDKHLPKWLIEDAVRQLKERAAEADADENIIELKSALNRKWQGPKYNSPRSVDFSPPSLQPLRPAFSPTATGSHNVDIGTDNSRRSSEFPGDLLSHVPLSYNSHIPGTSLNVSSLHLSDQASYARKCGSDTEESVLRRAIVEIMFATIMFETPVDVNDTDKSKLKLNTKLSTDGAASDQYDDNSKHNSSSISSQRNRSQSTSESRSNPLRFHKSEPKERELPSFSDVLDDASETVELLWYRKGQYIGKYGERCRGLIYVLDGSLEVGHHPTLQSNDNDGNNPSNNNYERLYDVETGNITGFLETISSYSSFVDLIAKRDTCVAILSKSYFEKMAEIYPLLYISAAKALTTSLTRPMVQLDFALEWISIKSGGRLLIEGTSANAIYFVLNGRMRGYHQQKLIGDFGYGSTIGELETMSGEPYSATVVAVRDTELSRFPRTLVESLARQYPSITFEMSRMVVQAMRARSTLSNSEKIGYSDFKTLAVLQISPGIQVEEFAVKLSSAFQFIGREVMVLTNSVILRQLGRHAFQKMGVLKLRAYLAYLEDRYDVLIYVADGLSTSQWSRTCVDQADCVLLLADGSAQPIFSEVERMVVRSPTRSRAHLVLLHNEKQVPHGSTAKWLKHRPWISAHHHIQMAIVHEDDTTGHPRNSANYFNPSNQQNRVKRTIKGIKNKVQDEIRLLQHRKFLKRYVESPLVGTSRSQYKNDFNRLARVLAGESVGLVLGGGGARGLSHIGVIQALEEAGIPIDMVGGTSIGSLIGGLYAQEYDIVPLLRKAKQFSVRVSSFWRVLLDITYPMMAWTTGHAFNRAVWKCLSDSRIEDFWVKYFTNTTNLSLSRMEVHQRGYAWRYIRASMSLAGLLPPIEEKGQMLLDGGYVDNLPVFEMQKMGARYIIAVDVGAVDDATPLKYGDTLSGVWALVNKWNPFSTRPNVPNIAEIQQRLTYVSSVKALEEAKRAKGVIYLRPPIDNYATLDFSKFDEIRQVGFEYGSTELRQRIIENKIPTVFKPSVSKKEYRHRHRRYSF